MEQLGLQPVEMLFCTERTQIYRAQTQTRRVYVMQERHLGLPLTQAQARIKNLRQLSHPNIMKVLEVVTEGTEQDSVLTIVYEHYDTNLLDFTQSLQGQILSPEIMKTLVTQLLSAMEFLQGKKFHHLSIRPQCVFVTKDYRLVLGFFPSDLLGTSHPQYIRDYNAEAEAIGNLIVMPQMLALPYKLLHISEEFCQNFDQFVTDVHMPDIVRETLSVLLKPENFAIDFRALKNNFINNRNLQNTAKAEKPSGLAKCEKCSLESLVQRSCSHRFCSFHGDGDFCSICKTYAPSETPYEQVPMPLEEQMKEWNKGRTIPKLDPKELRLMPDTVGMRRFPLQGLSAVNRDRGPGFVERLSHIFTSWRSSNNDGNSFFRCLGVIWLERLFSQSTPKSLREKWINRLRTRKRHFTSLPEVAHIFLKFIFTLISLHEDAAGNRLGLLQPHLMNQEFDHNLVIFMRTVSTQCLNWNLKAIQTSTDVVTPERLSELRTLGNEINAFNPLVQYVADAFSYNIDIYSLESPVPRPIKCSKPLSTGVRRASMLFMNGCYFILYSVTQDLLDGYDYASNTFRPVDLTKQYYCNYL